MLKPKLLSVSLQIFNESSSQAGKDCRATIVIHLLFLSLKLLKDVQHFMLYFTPSHSLIQISAIAMIENLNCSFNMCRKNQIPVLCFRC